MTGGGLWSERLKEEGKSEQGWETLYAEDVAQSRLGVFEKQYRIHRERSRAKSKESLSIRDF